MRRNMPRNIEAREWGEQIPVSVGEMESVYAPAVYNHNGHNHNGNGNATPPDPLVVEDPRLIERSILDHSGPIGETLTDAIFTPAFLASQIGKDMEVEFLIDDHLAVKSGELVAVGASYILLRSRETGEVVMGDLYAIKFVTIKNNNNNY